MPVVVNLKAQNQGPPGISIMSGSGAPSISAVIGTLYIDQTNGDLWQQQISGWTQTGNLQGPPISSTFSESTPSGGANGDVWFQY